MQKTATKYMDDKTFKETFARIINSKNILLTIHSRPDGDAIASICILMELLEGYKKKFTAYSQDKTPHQYFYLPHTEKIISDKTAVNFLDYDAIIALDCGSVSRTGLAEEIKHRNNDQLFIEFDHHPKMDDYSDFENRCPECASTTEVLYHFLKSNRVSLNKNYANCILTGLLTDTGNFLFPITSDQSINIASEMLIYGARFPQIMENTLRNKSLGAMRLWGHVLSSIKINKKYNIAFSIIQREEVEKNNVSDEELESLSNFISNLHDVRAILLLQEVGLDELKGSLRTAHSQIDVSKLARLLGGGGHTKAAGFRIGGRLLKTENSWKII